jgi:putative nucleotidyltransferase with HDIG domain
MKAQFIAPKGEHELAPLELKDGETVLIGRGDGCQLQILDAGLSRRQCELRRDGERLVLRDLESRNGTWVNGVRIKETTIRHGDLVRLAGLELLFHAAYEDTVTPATPLPTGDPSDSDYRARFDLNESTLMQLPNESQTLENYRRVQRDLSTLYRMGDVIHSERTAEQLYKRMAREISEVVQCDRCLVLLANGGVTGLAGAPVLRVVAFESAQGSVTFSHTIVDESFAKGVCILRANAMEDERFGDADSIIRESITSVICVPIESPDGILGVIYVDTLGRREGFRRHNLELLAAIGRQAGIAIRRLQLAEELRGSFFGTVRALVASIEAKDGYTKGHSDRVTNYALRIGKRLHLSTEDLQTLELACLLHDVGKIGVMESLLTKPGPLTGGERSLIERHPEVGARIISNIQKSAKICEIVQHHHERWDGSGYPGRLRGDGIPKLARILAVADTVDAMTSERPYRQARTLQEVAATLKDERKRQFDGDIATVALTMLEQGELGVDVKT